MSNPKDNGSFLGEFKKFLEFLRNLWSTLAGISLLFPLSNVLIKIIPLAKYDDEGGLVYFSPQLVTAITTLACLFIILWTYGKRHSFSNPQERQSIQKRAGLSFAIGVVSLVIYLVFYFAVKTGFYFDVLGWQSGDPQRVFGDIVLLVAYGAFFLLVTRAFVLLGMIEYFGQKDRAA